MTHKQLTKNHNKLARLFYKNLGYTVDGNYEFQKAKHPQEIMCWNMAVIAFEELIEKEAKFNDN